MASLVRTYRSNIVEGKGFLILSILFGVIMRIIYFLNFQDLNISDGNGYLWQPMAWLFSNPLVSLAVSAALTGGMAFFAAHINTEFLLIRNKTIYPPAFIVLLFSCHPSFAFMSAEYISAFLTLYIVALLFSSYNEGGKQTRVFKASFILAVGSLFTPVVLVYLPILWIAYGIMRCFNLKSIPASILGIFVVYFPAFSYYFLSGDLNTFLQPFTSIVPGTLSELPIFNYSVVQWIILAYSILLLIIIISDNYINRHKDKIKIRAYINLLTIMLILAITITILLNITPIVSIFISLIIGSLLLSHFFALAEKSVTVIFFLFSVIFYVLVCFIPFLPL